MTQPEIEYIRNQIKNHVALFFNDKAKHLFGEKSVRFLPYAEAAKIREKIIAIPCDIPVSPKPEKPYRVKFNNVELTLWNRIDPPSGEGWEKIPNESTPLWYENEIGTLIPAWNLFGNLFQLLTFGEESGPSRKDKHGRFAAAFSPRLIQGLLEIPAFNEAVAALIAACHYLQFANQSLFTLNELLRPPVITLSHDCDILTGNDLWTQSVRAYRVLLPIARLRMPKVDNLWWIIRNAFSPRKFYFDNAAGMIDIERCFDYSSTFYILNGTGGRFGARSGLDIIPELLKEIPPGWDVGMHYNYDTFLNEAKFESQMVQLQNINSSICRTGRAHYLRIDPSHSFSFLKKYGIYIDESSGYADRIGYRNGIAGCFQAYDPVSKKAMDIWEVPLSVMDAVLVNQYGNQAISVFSKMIHHLSHIGGALTVVFHPGQFNNPEHKQMLGIYHRMLIECHSTGAVSRTARSMVDSIRRD
jgi:hypothetical protein